MEQINQQLQKITQELTNYSKAQKKITGLTEEENKIIEMKYSGGNFGSMSDQDRLVISKLLLLKIHVIMGWVLPQDEQLTILVDQFQKQLSEEYKFVNPSELEYAFRQAGVVKDWGKFMNLSLIDEVVKQYLEKRNYVSRIEEQKKMKELPNTEKHGRISDDEMTDWWEQTAKMVKKGNYTVDLIPPGFYEWMDESGGIHLDKSKKGDYFERATLYRHSTIAAAYEKNPHSIDTKKTLADFNQMRTTKEYSKDEYKRVVELAKKMVVFDLMKMS